MYNLTFTGKSLFSKSKFVVCFITSLTLVLFFSTAITVEAGEIEESAVKNGTGQPGTIKAIDFKRLEAHSDKVANKSTDTTKSGKPIDTTKNEKPTPKNDKNKTSSLGKTDYSSGLGSSDSISTLGEQPEEGMTNKKAQGLRSDDPGNTEEDEGDSENSDGEKNNAPLTTDELLALESNEFNKGKGTDNNHVLKSLDKAIAKWKAFAAKGGSGSGVVKRLQALRDRITNDTTDTGDEKNTDVDSDNDDNENYQLNNTDNDNDEDDDETDESAANSNSTESTDTGSGADTDTETDEDEDNKRGSNKRDESNSDTSNENTANTSDETETVKKNSRDNLAPECSFKVEVTKSGLKHGKVRLNNFNFFDKADPKTKIASGAKKIRLSNDGQTWKEYPANTTSLKNMFWKFGTADTNGNVTIHMQAGDNEGNWGNGTNKTYTQTFNIN